jgi:phosphate starvation-inducible protein PhoH
VFDNVDAFVSLCGQNDNTIKFMERELGIEIFPRGNELLIEGENKIIVSGVKKALELIYDEAKKGKYLEKTEIKYLLEQIVSIDGFEKEDFEKVLYWFLRLENSSKQELKII